MVTQFSRTQLTFGRDNMAVLAASRVAVFGIGGVGSYVVEALVRSGVGAVDLIDDDKVCLTNINRQLYALRSTVGRYKADVAAERIHDINPDCRVTVRRTFFMPETAGEFSFSDYDYVADCIDTVTGKVQIAVQAHEAGVPAISCMGAGNKVEPSLLRVADISRTRVCPLARVMRRELRRRGIAHLKVVYSEEPAIPPVQDDDISCKFHCVCPPGTKRTCERRHQVPGSNAFVPAAAGLLIASEIVRDLTGFHPTAPDAPAVRERTAKAARRPPAAVAAPDGGVECGAEWL